MLEVPDGGLGGVEAGAAGDHGEILAEADLVEFLEVGFELYHPLLPDLILIEPLISLRWFLQHLTSILYHHQPILLSQLLLQLPNLPYFQFPHLIIPSLEETIGVVLEGDFLGGDVDLMLGGGEADEDGLLAGGGVDFGCVVLVDEDDAPF